MLWYARVLMLWCDRIGLGEERRGGEENGWDIYGGKEREGGAHGSNGYGVYQKVQVRHRLGVRPGPVDMSDFCRLEPFLFFL